MNNTKFLVNRSWIPDMIDKGFKRYVAVAFSETATNRNAVIVNNDGIFQFTDKENGETYKLLTNTSIMVIHRNGELIMINIPTCPTE